MFFHKLTDEAELRLIEPRHAEELYSLIDRNREHLRPWMRFADNSTSEDSIRAFAKNSLHQFADNQGFYCGIVYEGKLAGGVGMLPIDQRNRSVEIGYWLDKEAEGKGLVTASCRAIMEHCFNKMQLNRIEMRMDTRNKRSQAVAHRLGAKHEGTQRQSMMINSNFIDQKVFSILREEWPAGSVASYNAFFTHKLDDSSELGILEPLHAEEIFALIDRNREHLRRWLPWVDGTKSPDNTRAFIKQAQHQFAEDGSIVAGIWHKGGIAGIIGLRTVSAKCMEIGYWIGEEYQGKGLVTTACKALISNAFTELGINRIQIHAKPNNDRSRAIPERLGFTCEGREIDADGKPIDLMAYSLLKDKWEAQTNER